ncbi:TolC family outer membrane protein [Dyella tabacisoli]|uniref:Type I secretion protein TolC n=1 Tax=Dyella tabacisoli TaxID=2282381 RepID=A0A369UL26_9GAMM|nr:TolC family outer membrane protein [Dyella tabacisoli]RDD80300.1 type I secretion protein TolC [Dyella tabacisoli]
MRLKLLTLALTLAVLPLSGRSEDLLDAYREARANNPTLAQSDAQRLSTAEGITQSRALLLPQLSAGLTFSQASGADSRDSAGGHSRSRQLSATLNQSILDLSKWANLSAARSQSESQDQTYQAALQALYVEVTQAYFLVLTSEDALTFAKANEDAYRQAYEQADQRFKVGLSAVTDVYQAKSYYENAKAQTIAAQNTLNDAREGLTQVTGKQTGELKKLREELPMDPPTPNDPNTWVQEALKNNPNILAQQYNVEAAEHTISAARAGHLPTISATVQRGKTTGWLENGNVNPLSSSALGNGRYGTTAGVTLSVPIFSGGATQSHVRQSIYQRDSAQDGLEIQRRQVTRNTLNYYRSVVAGIAQVQAAKASVDSGQKALEATRAGFDVGTQTMLNVLNAIQTLTQSESTYSQTRHAFILDKLQLKQSSGAIDLKDVEEVNALLQ